MSDIDIAAARALCDAATPGPWLHDDDGFMGCGSVWTAGPGVEGGSIAAPSGDLYPRSGYDPRADMAFIAAARDLVPTLLDEVEQLQQLVSAKQSWIDGAKVDLEAADVPMSPNKGHDETGALADLQERIARAIDHRWDVEADSNEPSGYTEGLLDGLDAAATVARETPLRGEP